MARQVNIPLDQVRDAWEGLTTHRLRSALTALGVIFGVAAVIGMASIGEGAKREALKQIELMGASNILIDEAEIKEGDQRKEALEKSPHGLTVADSDALQLTLGESGLVVPVQVGDYSIQGGGVKEKMSVVSTRPSYYDLYRIKPALGRVLILNDEASQARVCLLGWGARRALFPLQNPVGQTIKIKNVLFTVVGVAERRSSQGGDMEGISLRDENRDVYIPLTVSKSQSLGTTTGSELTRIVVSADPRLQLASIADVAERLLVRRHRGVNDYKVIIPEQLLRQRQATQRIFNVVMGAIASISLIVGGIGIMNIMLASVLERTREIGIRRAVGATEHDITRQFLGEAVLLSLLGGLAGVILGLALAKAISLYAGWETAVSTWAILTAVGVSAGVGIVFGWLPARRAAKLDPIVALRYE